MLLLNPEKQLVGLNLVCKVRTKYLEQCIKFFQLNTSNYLLAFMFGQGKNQTSRGIL